TDPELLKKYSKVYFLNEHYVPLSLRTIDPDYLSPKATNKEISSDVWPFLRDLFQNAADDGLSLQALSAYRSFGTQSALKASYTFTYGAGTANRFSADQGYSEHQLGTTLDFTTAKTGVLEGFNITPEYKWLQDNAHKYGFVLSYPLGNTYYKFEPWHWRFVGVALATKLHEDGEYFYDTDQRVIDTYLANLFD
ncbi:MAG: M15 family metallopeptidase, partial [Candidatus Paceibacterota bacterium]